MQSAARRGAALIAAAGIAAATPGARPLLAQQTPAAPEPSAHHGSPVIKWGKWAAAAAAVSFTTLGIRQHNAGDAGFSDLVHYCRTTLCTLAPGGRYADPEAEALYQRVVRDDRLARVWFIGGQVAALGSALLFVLELRRTREPPSIPFSGLVVRSDAYGVRLGWRLAF
jgi:hypothetical protein